MATKQALAEAVEIVAALVRNICLKRALSAADADPHLNFWRVMYGNQMDMAVIDWCKLFGSDSAANNPTHWKNIVSDEAKFRTDMLAAIGKTTTEWEAYWIEMRDYRNWAAAHHDVRRRTIAKYPHLDVALANAFFFYDYLRTELKAHDIDQRPDDIRTYAKAFEDKALAVAKTAMAATKRIEEDVY
jgi:hypothetical protein